jgi:hypothetical protein
MVKILKIHFLFVRTEEKEESDEEFARQKIKRRKDSACRAVKDVDKSYKKNQNLNLKKNR